MGLPKTAQSFIGYKEITNNPDEIAANTTADISLTMGSALPSHFFDVQAPSLESGLVLGQAWCETAGTVKVRLANVTASPINPASQTFKVLIR